MFTPDSLDLDLYAYDDYRLFLHDYLQQARKRDRKISHRFLTARIGINSSGWFADLLKGRANLGGTQLVKLAALMKLKPREADYLEALVQCNQAGSIEERNRHYRKLAGFRAIQADLVGKDRAEYYNKWYYAAIRELLFFHEFRGDYAALGRKLDPPIRAAEAREAVGLLERLGFLCKDAQGAWRPLAATLKKDGAYKSVFASNFLKASMELGMHALDRFPKEQRHVSSMTLSFSGPGFQEALEEIEGVRKKLVALMQEDAHPDKVYQLNFQFFPVTREETR